MERYIPEGEMTQEEQWTLIQDTGNGYSIPQGEAEELLREVYGEPDENGLYLKPEEG